MEDHQSKLSEPGHLGIEMDVPEDKNYLIRQVGPFTGSARRLSTNSQRPNGEVNGHQVVGNVPPIQDKEVRHDIDITSGTYDLRINRSPGTSASGQCIGQEQSTPLLHRDILDTQMGREDGHDSEAASDDGYFLERHELQFKCHSERDIGQLHSTREELTQVFHRDVLDTQVLRGGNKHDVETTGDESYFLAKYELPSERFSERDAKRRPSKPEPTQAFVHSSKSKPNRGAKQHHTTPGESVGEDGEYWRRIFLNKDDVTSEESSLEQGEPEAKRQWYRARKMRPEYFRSPPSTNLEFWFILLALIMTIISVVLIVLLWEYLSSISS